LLMDLILSTVLAAYLTGLATIKKGSQPL